MRRKATRLIPPLSVILVFALILGQASYAFAKPAAHAQKVEVLVSFTEKPGSAEETLIHNNGGKVKRTYHLVPTIAASIPKGKIDSLRRNPKVVCIEKDIVVQVTEVKLPWGVDRIDAEVVHSQNKGQGVRVAILDTGIDLDHPDLRVVGDTSFVYETVNGDDDNGHGTRVAGIVAALDNDIGVIGVAPEAELYAVKVLNSRGSGRCSDILSGIEWAIDHDMQVVNMSFATSLNLPQAIRTALEKAYQAGIVLVAGAGNTGTDSGEGNNICAPARYAPVIAVGATDELDNRCSFSSTGDTLELTAPGVNIYSTTSGGGYANVTGTSASSPHVTGAAALLIASGVTSNAEVRQIFQGTAVDLGPSEWDSCYGYGLVNAAQAVNAEGNNKPQDKMPPTTTIKLSGLQGNGGWYRSDVKVELTAVDHLGGSGVTETQYSLDSGKTWQSYQEPFTITREGINVIQARSQDNAGNVEALPAYSEVKIDKTGPRVNISADPSLIWPANHKQLMVEVLVTGSADDEFSGLNSVWLAVKDEYGKVEPAIGPYLEALIQLEAWRDSHDFDGRVYIISIMASDCAGNKAVGETRVTVPHDRGKREVNSEKSN